MYRNLCLISLVASYGMIVQYLELTDSYYKERQIMYKERASGTYRASTYALAARAAAQRAEGASGRSARKKRAGGRARRAGRHSKQGGRSGGMESPSPSRPFAPPPSPRLLPRGSRWPSRCHAMMSEVPIPACLIPHSYPLRP